jgi:hypothetical protein
MTKIEIRECEKIFSLPNDIPSYLDGYQSEVFKKRGFHPMELFDFNLSPTGLITGRNYKAVTGLVHRGRVLLLSEIKDFVKGEIGVFGGKIGLLLLYEEMTSFVKRNSVLFSFAPKGRRSYSVEYHEDKLVYFRKKYESEIYSNFGSCSYSGRYFNGDTEFLFFKEIK